MRSVESSFAAPRQVAGRALQWWTGTSRFAAFVQGFAVLLLLYLPLENWLTAGLTGSLQWVVRLFPDALICLLAAIVAVGMAGGLLRYRWALVGIAVVTGLIVVGDLMRGFGAIDSVNAVRVVVRYLALGAVLAAVLPRDQSFAGALWSTVIVVGIVQIVAAVVQILATAAAGGAAGIPILTGTTGRYDRFGLLMVALTLALIAAAVFRPRRWHAALVVVALVFLFWSTSRQAMVAVAVGSAIPLLWPRVPLSVRAGAALTLAAVAVMVVLTGSRASDPITGEGSANGPGPVGPGGEVLPSMPPRELGSSTVSIDPNRNFRLYLNLVLAPWAASQEPLFGMGPGRHADDPADPRLEAKVEGDGIPWWFARSFMNDSNYASLVVQFGVLTPALFLATIAGAVLLLLSSLRRNRNVITLFAAMFGVAMLAAAFFGPAFEIRPTSAILWLAVFTALAAIPLRREA